MIISASDQDNCGAVYPGVSGNCCFKECKATSADGSCCTKDEPCGLYGGDCDGGNQQLSSDNIEALKFKMPNVPGTWSVDQIIVGQFGVRIHQVCGIAAFNRIRRRLLTVALKAVHLEDSICIHILYIC